MGSIMMHLCISEQIKNKHNFGDSFLIGALLPDIYKRVSMTNEESHYLIKINKGEEIYNVPKLDAFIQENRSKISDEVYIGYFAHLLEDYIWERFIVKNFAICVLNKKTNDEVYLYNKEKNSIEHTKDEYQKELYQDYNFWDKYINNMINIDIENLRKKVGSFLNDSKYDATLDEIIVHQPINEKGSIFITEELINRYIKTCIVFFEIEYSKYKKA